MRRLKAVLIALAWLLVSDRAWAQLEQYIAPGSLGLPQVSTREAIEKAVADARWRLGGLRLEPSFGIHNIGYVENVFAEPGKGTADFTATVGLGLKAYLPLGPKTTLAAHVVPEYAWWQELDDLSGTQFRYGAGLFSYLNRLTLEAKGTVSDGQSKVSSELEAPAQITARDAEIAVAVDIAGPFAFFAGASRRDNQYEREALGPSILEQLPLLDRTEDVVRGGLRYERGGFRLGLGAQRSKTTFDGANRDRSNSGEGPLLLLDLEGNRISGGFDVAYLTLEPEAGSEFQPVRDLSGRFRLDIDTGHRLSTGVYGAQQVLYTLAAGSSHAIERRLGVALGMPLGWRTKLRAFAETGTSDFEGSGEVDRRSDDLRTFGVDFSMELYRSLSLILGFARTEHSSSLPGLDRTTTSLRTGLTVSGDTTW